MKKQLGNRGLQIFDKCQIRPLTPASLSTRFIILKSSCIFLIISSRTSKCVNILKDIMACESFASVKFDLLPMFKVMYCHHAKQALSL